MKALTAKQQNVYDYIRKKVGRIGYPPSVREIAQQFGISTRAAYDHLRAIEKKGYIRRDPMKPRAIEIVGSRGASAQGVDDVVRVPVLGRVAAGLPILAEENVEEYMTFPTGMVKQDGNVFALEVHGDSMIEDGIMDGDYVLVREQPVAETGETVVALLDDEATVKRFYRRNDRFELVPAHPTMEPIIADEVSIVGKVVGVYRRMD
ncbi:MAG: transcriptional repressor LexA [Gemmatimonadetes bacterium]|nr:transcriptional repressor LexA [Gemmatimonadota bacterium]MXY49678.1 transcriptional repressor LexA [Gemmatimonadota bacterium]MYG83685.1 transcriptional repressor LexA [Gemmatimonadota bacterium]MYJ88794.1 transcriptional repressor LexA [Gemmatimonadota bacterium]